MGIITYGTGLIGIKGNGNATTINNTADGVINVYADDSYAFGGTTKAIINNGEINLLCDSGCDIYAPGTTGTQNDHNGTADIAIPDATTAPTEGSIPTPPADPNAPQLLSNYIVGTNADGSSGTLQANNLVIGDNVKVDTGFTSGAAVDSIVGLKLDYAGKDGWSATATLEGGPNLSYSKSQRTVSLQGAAGQSFGVDDGQKGGGVNGLATIGVKYSSNDTTLHLDAYQWKEDGISDKGFMLNVKKTFR